ncbi:esterase-like activity of phytase family protein [Sulfurimonas paralvinellae]|uniref:Esterase-like activity of phytase family protein n=1 Tax=Sulfurimonas paralvinellae TaxID=317658 RepID=A0A7M1B986_9BACT|nr:esterase-like activity of phytase family protein [Sulfurimonas paralvinellae]QOP46287.1 esterase-like activity of phytase family protein [Sulfurimonas paralvinellae]
MFKSIILIFALQHMLHADMTAYTITPAKQQATQNSIKILDAKELQFPNVHEFSGLVYKDNMLYALSDQGSLYLFDIIVQNDRIQKLTLREHYLLRNKKSEPFKKKKRDSEGITFYKDGFLISFERKNRVLFCSRRGKKIKKMKLNALLEDNEKYQSPNKGLESVAYSQKYGIITIPELPLKDKNSKYHTLYAKDELWKFHAQGAVTDIAFIDSDNLLILLREYSYLTNRHITSLVKVNLANCNEKRVCQRELIAKLDSDAGWHIDNFEGVTKVGKNRFLMVSDDNDSMFQKTLLVLFEIMN